MPQSKSEASPVKTFAIEPLKQRDLLKCVLCRKGVMHNHSITFYRLRLSEFIVYLPAVQRQDGMERMLAPASFLAGIMGPDEDMALPLREGIEFHLCTDCAFTCTVASIVETIAANCDSGVNDAT